MSTQQQQKTGLNTAEINEFTALVNSVTGAALDGAKHIANDGHEPYIGRK